MILAHCGVAIATMGAVMSSYFGSELGVRLAPQQSQQLGQFEFHYDRFPMKLDQNFYRRKSLSLAYQNKANLTLKLYQNAAIMMFAP